MPTPLSFTPTRLSPLDDSADMVVWQHRGMGRSRSIIICSAAMVISRSVRDECPSRIRARTRGCSRRRECHDANHQRSEPRRSPTKSYARFPRANPNAPSSRPSRFQKTWPTPETTKPTRTSPAVIRAHHSIQEPMPTRTHLPAPARPTRMYPVIQPHQRPSIRGTVAQARRRTPHMEIARANTAGAAVMTRMAAVPIPANASADWANRLLREQRIAAKMFADTTTHLPHQSHRTTSHRAVLAHNLPHQSHRTPNHPVVLDHNRPHHVHR